MKTAGSRGAIGSTPVAMTTCQRELSYALYHYIRPYHSLRLSHSLLAATS